MFQAELLAGVKMQCPKCKKETSSAIECEYCGIIFDKYLKHVKTDDNIDAQSDKLAVVDQQESTPDRESHGILRHIIPQYDEIVLRTMSVTCALLLLDGVLSTRGNIHIGYPEKIDPRLIVIFMIFLTGVALSIYHALIDRPKTAVEKSFMLFFAALLNAFVGITVGAYTLTTSMGWFIVYPIANLLNGVVLIFMFMVGVVNESNIRQEHASLGHVVFAAIVVLILFVICHYIFDLIWFETLSICLIYVTNLIHVIESLFYRVTPKSRLI
jgi:hypothetical protein